MDLVSKIGKSLYFIIEILFFTFVFSIFLNQLGYWISADYYEQYLFSEYGIDKWSISNNIGKVVWLSILSSYWVGFLVSLVYAGNYILISRKDAFEVTQRRIRINLLYAIVGCFVGFLIGKYLISWENSTIRDVEYATHPQNFISVHFMHKGGFICGVVGVFVSTFYLIKYRLLGEIHRFDEIDEIG